jgi:hypothetical protein
MHYTTCGSETNKEDWLTAQMIAVTRGVRRRRR